MKVINFKTVSPLFEMERDGTKWFTERLADVRDESFDVIWRWDIERRTKVAVKITNPATGESFIRKLTGVADLIEVNKPRWLILYLGDLIPRPDNQ